MTTVLEGASTLQHSQILVCFLCTGEKRNLDLHHLLVMHVNLSLQAKDIPQSHLAHLSDDKSPAGTPCIVLAVSSVCKICTLMKYCSRKVSHVFYSSTNASSIFFGYKPP